MNYLMIILPKMLSFLLMISLGFLCARTGIIRKEGMSTLSGFLLKLVLPCLIISLMHERGTGLQDVLAFRCFVTGQVLVYAVLALAGLASAKLFRFPRKTFNVHAACMMCDNYAFVVIPIIMALYGPEDGQAYIPIGSAVDTILVWTLGLSLFTLCLQKDGGLWGAVKALLSKFTHPFMLCTFAMLFLNTFSIPIPGPVLETASSIGSISASLGLLYVGANICFMDKGNMKGKASVAAIAGVKLLLVPFLDYLTASRFLSETEAVILMLIAGAPSMTTSCMIANQYGLDEDYAAAAVFVTTMCCLFTIPILFLLIGAVR